MEYKKMSFYVKVAEKKIMLIELSLCPENQNNHKWFDEKKCVIFLKRIKEIAEAIFTFGETCEGPHDIKEILQGPEVCFYMLYTLKKCTSGQICISTNRQVNKVDEQKKENIEMPGFSSDRTFFTFCEKLSVCLSQDDLFDDLHKKKTPDDNALKKKRKITEITEKDDNALPATCNQQQSINIRDVPIFRNVKEVADLTDEHIKYLIKKRIRSKLKNIMDGKKYSRRHKDFMKGRHLQDLNFQVRFQLYTDAQSDTITEELMAVFYKKKRNFSMKRNLVTVNYITKVLLPEAFILIYQEVSGGNYDEVEKKMMGIIQQ